MKHLIRLAAALLTAVILAFAAGAARAEEPQLRGWDPQAGYQYVALGLYPYYEDGTKAPVLWEVLDAGNGEALLFTVYLIDAHQPIECDDPQVANAKTYRRLNDYGESDLHVWLNETMIHNLLGDEPVLAAVLEKQYGRRPGLTVK